MGECEVGRSSWGGGATGVCVRAYERAGVRGRRCVCACACGCVQRVVSPRVGWRARAASGRAGWLADGLCDDGCGGGACDRGGAERAVVVSGSGGDGERGGGGRLGIL